MTKYTKLNKSEAALPKKEPKSSSRRMLYTVLALISIFILFATFNHKAASAASNLAEQAVTNQEKVISYIILLEPTLSDAEKKEKINTFCKQYGGVVKNEFKFISGYEIGIYIKKEWVS